MTVLESPIEAAYRATGDKLTAALETWGQQVYADVVGSKGNKPYVVFSLSAGRELNFRATQDASLVLDIMAWADDAKTALRMAARIDVLLNDKGEQEAGNAASTDFAEAGSEWSILTITKEQIIHMVDSIEGARQIYGDGGRYRYHMERV